MPPSSPVPGRKLGLSHLGVCCFDLPRMVAFYTGTLGMTETDRGALPPPLGAELVFLTTDPAEHHQLVLVSGRREGEIQQGPALGGSFGTAIFQLSFRLEDLATLRRVRQRLADAGCTHLIALDHGNAWSLYTRDPEGNALEFVVDSPWYVHQPCGEPLDLSLDDDEILRRTQALCAQRGGEPYAAWRERIAARIARDQAGLG
jgi:catechol 2,3-dioxygenase-like lactoylglutathione lyase family enzyme